jgi:hypothetical protein
MATSYANSITNAQGVDQGLTRNVSPHPQPGVFDPFNLGRGP